MLARMCRGNLVGNGSAALMRRDAVLEAGGFDPTLRARRAQGCEDLLLYCRIAARHHAAVVPDFLTGYRQSDETMSRDLAQMIRSWRLVAAELRGRHPELRADIEAGEVFAVRWLLGRALWARDLRAAWTLATDGAPVRPCPGSHGRGAGIIRYSSGEGARPPPGRPDARALAADDGPVATALPGGRDAAEAGGVMTAPPHGRGRRASWAIGHGAAPVVPPGRAAGLGRAPARRAGLRCLARRDAGHHPRRGLPVRCDGPRRGGTRATGGLLDSVFAAVRTHLGDGGSRRNRRPGLRADRGQGRARLRLYARVGRGCATG